MRAPVLRADREVAIAAALRAAGISVHRMSGSNMAGFPITFAHVRPASAGPRAVEVLTEVLGWADTEVIDRSGMVVIETGRVR